jgi:GTPase
MLRRCGFALAGGAVPMTKAREQWTAEVNKFVEDKKKSALEGHRARMSRIRESRDFTPVDVAFPKLRDAAVSELKGDAARPAVANQPADAHVVRTAIIGTPNAGKSSLVNSLVTTHVAATANKAGTTVRNKAAFATVGNTQISFIDTPGMFVPRRTAANPVKFDAPAASAYEAFDSLMRADVAIFAFCADNRQIDPDDVGILRKVRDMCVRRDMPLALAITKYDLVKNKGDLAQKRYMHLRDRIDEVGVDFADSFETSAKTFFGIVELKDFISRYAKPGPWAMYRTEAHDMLPPERAVSAINEALMRHVTPTVVVHQMSYKVVGWTRRQQHTEVFVEVFMPSTFALRAFYSALGAVNDHAQERLSYDLNMRIKLVFQAYVAPGGVRPNARAAR